MKTGNDLLAERIREWSRTADRSARSWEELNRILDHTEQSPQDRHVACKGLKCPNCGSEEVTHYATTFDNGRALQEALCYSCDAEWDDEYDLIGYINFRKLGET